MSKTKKYLKSQIKQLPYILGKTAGAVMSVIGFAAGIFIFVREHAQTSTTLIYFIVGVSGIIIFILCDKLLKRIPSNKDAEPISKENKLAWVIFAALAVIFILLTYIITK